MPFNKIILALFTFIVLFSCKKEDPEPTPSPTPKNPYEDYFIEYKVDSSLQTFFKGTYDFQVFSYGYPSLIDSVEYFNLGETTAQMSAKNGAIGGVKISFGGYSEVNSSYVLNKKQAIATVCSLGSHSLVYDPAQTSSHVTIEAYYNSELYVSYYGFQPGTSSLIVNESSEMTGSSGYQKVKGTFTCRLFKQSNQSEFIDLTDGKFYLYFSMP